MLLPVRISIILIPRTQNIFAMFSAKNTFDPNEDIPALDGKIFVVTGGSAGIGIGTS